MKCPECQTENQDERKFCYECGARLSKICPECGRENLPRDKFCGECGHDLAQLTPPAPKELSFDEKLEKIQKYLPGGLTEKILSQRGKIEGERKQVTVMFADMEGFTPLVEKLGPEEAYSIMDQVYEILIHKVHDYEGTVNEMTGDGIMALFGAPRALEDAPQRAIRSAQAIHREITRFSDKIRQEKKSITPLKMRIGIHTGPVVVGALGNDLRVEFKAVGDTVNLASRMESLAEPGATYVTDETFRLTEGFFRFEALGKREVKGKKESVKIYRVIGRSTSRTRFDVSAERGLTPFVGRERELELLLDGLERARQGRGQAFSIVAEAGIGKSRLLYEFRKSISNEDITFIEGKCLSYSRGVAYHPIIDLYKSNFDIRETDTDLQIKDKIRNSLKQLEEDETSTLPYIFDLLSIKDKDSDLMPISPELRKERMMETLIRIPLKGSEIRPLILAIEDLHWVDKGSEEVLKYMLESIPGAKIFLIFTYRPEFVHTWGGRSYHSQVTLNRLSNRESLTMVSHILDGNETGARLEELILEKTEGVPFYIEEFLKSLLDLKLIELHNGRYDLSLEAKQLAIPSTIQDVIMARVDSLPEGAKDILQTGSVIEREFSYELIKQVTNLPEQELLSRLSLLKDSELVYERGIYPKSTFIFKHALTREVVYDSIMSNKRRKLHDRIGRTILELFTQNAEPYFEILAEHFTRGENFDAGAKYWKLSARKASRSDLSLDAISHSQKALSCLDKIPTSKAVQFEHIKLKLELAQYYLGLNYHIEAKEAVDSVIDSVHEHNYDQYYPFINIVLGTYYGMVEEDFPKAIEHLEKAIEWSEKTQDYASAAGAYYFLGNMLFENGEYKKAFTQYNKAYQLAELWDYKPFMSSIKATVSALYICLGKINHAIKTSKEAIEIARSCDRRTKGISEVVMGCVYSGKGNIKEAESSLLKGMDLCMKAGQMAFACISASNLALLYSGINNFEKSLQFYHQAVDYAKKTKLRPSYVHFAKTNLGALNSLISNNDFELNRLTDILKTHYNWPNYLTDAHLLGRFLIKYNYKHIDESEFWIRKIIELSEQLEFRLSLGRSHVLLSELYKYQNNMVKAQEQMNIALEILKECGADGWVEKYEKELAEIS